MEGREGKESAPLDLNPGDATVLLNFLLRRNISSETSGKLKNSWHWLTISEDPVLNILNKMGL